MEPDTIHHLGDAPAPLGPRPDSVDAQRLRDDRPDRTARVQRGIRILEDHLHLAANGP
jgi:hypothetical protein